jgi:SWI/SNF-related matrix-associated actin-dependent regulator of chromatin subfamily D
MEYNPLMIEPGPMISGAHPPSALTAAQAQQQQDSQRKAAEDAKRRSRRPTDKNIPEGVGDCIVGDGVQRYRELREAESKLDAAMMRKRLDIQDSRNRNFKVNICNTHFAYHLPVIAT